MDFGETIDFLLKISGPLALIIISIPRATELVLGRFLSASLEKTKQKLQIEIEKIKADLAKELELTKAQLHQNQIQNQRNYDEVKNRNSYICKILEDLLLNTKDTLDKLESSQAATYRVMENYLDRTFLKINTKEIPSCLVECLNLVDCLKLIEEACEAPLAMEDSRFVEKIRSKLTELIAIIESEILKIKGHSI